VESRPARRLSDDHSGADFSAGPGQPPALTIRLPLEGSPQVRLDCLNDVEQARLLDWLRSRPDYAELVDRALDLQQRDAA
jgi:hypothetical protein